MVGGSRKDNKGIHQLTGELLFDPDPVWLRGALRVL